tara:strand:- start:451 stop:1647 length:1197 start_codon:yes stop_codon:yes gene_type:complete
MKKKTKKIHRINSWPHYSKEESNAISRVLLSNKVNYWTGEEGKKFEKNFCQFNKSKYALTIANGTLALEVALKILEIKKNDEVIVTPRSFIASAFCILSVNAKPVFADVNRISGNICPEDLEKKITKKTKAIICVHLAGWPCEMDKINRIAKKFNLFVIEDCSQAHGTTYKGINVGNFGIISTWSFCQDKIITTGGEGGLITTNNSKIYNSIKSYRDHGKNFNLLNKKKMPINSYKWIHDNYGSNLRMTEMQSSIGNIQIKKLDLWNKKRKKNAHKILDTLNKFDTIIRVEYPNKDINHAWYRCYAYVKPENLRNGWSRDKIINEINNFGIPCFSGSCPEIYKEKAIYRYLNKKILKLSNAKELGLTSIAFLTHPTLTNLDIDNMCNVITKILAKASR